MGVGHIMGVLIGVCVCVCVSVLLGEGEFFLGCHVCMCHVRVSVCACVRADPVVKVVERDLAVSGLANPLVISFWRCARVDGSPLRPHLSSLLGREVCE